MTCLDGVTGRDSFPLDFHLEAPRKTADSTVRFAGGKVWLPCCCQHFPTRHFRPQTNHSSKRHFIMAAPKRREAFKQPALCPSSLKTSGVIKFRAALDSCPVTYSCWPPLFITFLRTMRASSWGVTTTIDRYEPTIIRFLQKKTDGTAINLQICIHGSVKNTQKLKGWRGPQRASPSPFLKAVSLPKTIEFMFFINEEWRHSP